MSLKTLKDENITIGHKITKIRFICFIINKLNPVKNDISAIFGMAKKLGIKTIPLDEAEKRTKEIVAREIAQEGQ